MDYFFQQLINGLTLGGVYALVALGYTMVYGIIQLINFAHGEIFAAGGYLGVILLSYMASQGLMDSHPWFGLAFALILAMGYCAMLAMAVEKVAYKPLRSAQRLSPLISAIGMSIFLQNYVLIAQTQDFLRFPNLIPAMPFLDPVSDILRPSSFMIIVTSGAMMIGLSLFIKFTRLGKAMRATAQNRKMAMLLGINADNIISATFVVGSALAAVGGILIAPHTQQINFNIGFLAGIKAFTAAVLGGIGSIPGAMFGGLVLGCCESFASGYISSDYEDMFAFAILILILIFRPSGLLGKARAQKV